MNGTPEIIPAAGPMNLETDLPEIQLRSANLPTADMDDETRKRYREMDPSDIDDAAIQAALGIIENPKVQDRIVRIANQAVNIPWIPEILERRIFSVAYNGIQAAGIYVLEAIASGGRVFADLFSGPENSGPT